MENPIKMDDLGVPLFSEISSGCGGFTKFHYQDFCWVTNLYKNCTVPLVTCIFMGFVSYHLYFCGKTVWDEGVRRFFLFFLMKTARRSLRSH